MRILTVADREDPALGEHFRPERWGNIDAIISCGDLKPEYLEYLSGRLNRPVFYVRGNHDITYEASPPGGCDNLDGRIVEFGGLRLLGFEGSLWYGGRGIEYSNGKMAMKIRLARLRMLLGGKPDIVVTHAPPRFCADLACDTPQGAGRPCVRQPGALCTEAADLPHAGFEEFRQLILKVQPRYFLHGHTHLGYNMGKRQQLIGRTRVIDCYGYHIIDTDEPSLVPVLRPGTEAVSERDA
jgi:uncharacterized protein